jgi:hypothetical protein
VLHRRSVSGDGGVIDHLVIAPTGIWIIDVSGENGRVERRDVGGFMRQDIRLFVDQHDRTDRTEAMSWQTDAIQRIIEPLDVVAAPLHRVLCFTDADWARFARPFDVVEVLVCWPASLISMIGDSGPFDSDTIDIVALQLDRELPPA